MPATRLIKRLCEAATKRQIRALVLSRCVGANGKVFAYEPVTPIYERLTANLALNHAVNVAPRPYGLGEKSGTLGFQDHRGEFNIGKGRVDPCGPRTIDVRTLDDEMNGIDAPISFIKIDVEGFELAVLKGANEILRRQRPVILCEYNPGAYQLADILASLPYPVRSERVPYTCWESLTPIDPTELHERADLLIVPADR